MFVSPASTAVRSPTKLPTDALLRVKGVETSGAAVADGTVSTYKVSLYMLTY